MAPTVRLAVKELAATVEIGTVSGRGATVTGAVAVDFVTWLGRSRTASGMAPGVTDEAVVERLTVLLDESAATDRPVTGQAAA